MALLRIKESALRNLKRLPFKARCQIDERLKKLAEDPERIDLDIKKLRGLDLYRLRSGDYRIIYQKRPEAAVILVLMIARNCSGQPSDSERVRAKSGSFRLARRSERSDPGETDGGFRGRAVSPPE